MKVIRLIMVLALYGPMVELFGDQQKDAPDCCDNATAACIPVMIGAIFDKDSTKVTYVHCI
jgi:hypothetical protein